MTKKKEPKIVEVNVQKEQVLQMFSGCSISFPWFGTLRSVEDPENAKAAEAIEADEDVVHTSVTIIDTSMEEYRRLQAIRTSTSNWYNYMTLPYVIKGQRLFMRDKRQELWEGVAERQKVLKEAAVAFQATREQVIEYGKKKLGKAFNLAFYPKDLGAKFDIVIREVSIDPPSYLAHTNAEEYKRTLELTLKDLGSAMQRFEQNCMAQLGRSVQNLVGQLNGDSALRSTTLEGMMRILNRVGQMRFEGTQLFNQAMADAKEVVDGVEISDLRRPGGTREDTKAKLQALLTRYQELREASLQKAVSE